jgi:hypothetical protein
MDKVQKPSSSECYAPSSEPFRIYIHQEFEFYIHLCSSDSIPILASVFLLEY